MSTRRALAFSFLDRYAGLVLAIASSMAIARLLTPQEIGVFSVTMVLLSFVSSFRDFGAGQYLVQEKELTTERIRATWTVQLGLGMLFALVGLAAAYPVAAFYGETRIVGLMGVLSLNFAISPFGSLTYAWLMREMRFDVLAVMRFSSSLAGAIASVGLAWKGFGPISLAYGGLVATVVNALCASYFRPKSFPWLPGFKEIRRVISFGGQTSLATTVNTLAFSSPELVLGKVHRMTAAGLYSRGNGLAAMFNKLVMDATQAVVMPLFAKHSREKTGIGDTFVVATAYTTSLGWSFFASMSLLAAPVIRILYGPQWDGAVTVTRLLCVGMGAGLAGALCPSALTAAGSVRAVLRTTVFTALLYTLLVSGGAFFSLTAMGICFILANVATAVLWLAQMHRVLPFDRRTLGRMMLKSLMVAAGAALGPAVCHIVFDDSLTNAFLAVAIGMLTSLLGFLVVCMATRHPIGEELARFWKQMCSTRKFLGRQA